MPRPAILVTGAHGQIGFELARLLAPLGEVVAADRAMLDLVRSRCDRRRRAPREARAHRECRRLHRGRSRGDRARARAGRQRAARRAFSRRKRSALAAVLIHFSTDYVFDGKRTTPYPEDAPTAPLNVYGSSKLEGERAIAAVGARAIVLRTSWVYGLRGKNFLLTIRKLAARARRAHDRRRSDRRSQLEPHARRGDGAHRRRRFARARRAIGAVPPVVHAGRRAGTTSRARSSAMRQQPRIVPITTADYPTPARRPAYGVLATSRFESTFGFALPHWREALASCVASPAEPRRVTARSSAPRAAIRTRTTASTSMPTDSARPSPGDDDRVHAERDASDALVHPIAAERCQRFGADLARLLVGGRDLAARARLDELHRRRRRRRACRCDPRRTPPTPRARCSDGNGSSAAPRAPLAARRALRSASDASAMTSSG